MAKTKKITLLFLPLFCTLLAAQTPTDSLQVSQPDSTQLVQSDSLLQTDEFEIKSNESDIDTTIYYDAKILRNALKERTSYFIGDAVIKYKNMQLTAGKITLKWDDTLIIAEALAETTWVKTDSLATDSTMQVNIIGEPELKDGGTTMVGDKMLYNYKTEKGRVVRGRSDIEDGHYTGQQIKRVDAKVFNVSHSIYTTCDNDSCPHFHFASPKMKMIPNDKVIAKPIYLYIGHIPVAALPFAVFPNKRGRQSGILVPNYGQSSVEGRYLRGIGYYWAPSDYWDTKLSTDFYEKSGWMFHNTTNYSKRYHYSGSVSGSLILKENQDTGTKTRRWDLRVRHNQDINPTSKFSINGTFISDNSYYKDFSNNLDTRLKREMRSNATYTKSWPKQKLSLSANASHVYDIQEDLTTMTLPQISFRKGQTQLFKQKQKGSRNQKWYNALYFNYSTNLVNTQQEKWDYEEKLAYGDTVATIDTSKVVDVDRRMTHNVSLSLNSPKKVLGILSVNHSMNITENWYDEAYDYFYDASDTSYYADKTAGFAAQHKLRYSMGVNTKIYGMFPGVGPVVAFRHVITPRLSFSYEPDYSKGGWGNLDEYETADGTITFDRFTGSESLSRGSARMSWSVANLFQMKTKSRDANQEKEKKLDLFNLDFRGGYDFKRDSNKMDDVSSSLVVSSSSLKNVSLSARTTHSFYEYDTASNKVSTEYLFKNSTLKDFKFARMTNLNLNMSFRLQGKDKSSGSAQGGRRDLPQNYEEMQDYERGEEEVDLLEEQSRRRGSRFEAENNISKLTIPWRTNVALRFSINSRNPENVTKNYSLSLQNTEIQLTRKWKIAYSLNMNLKDGEINSHQFTIYRDLHCWEAYINWRPSGAGKYVYVKVNVRSPMLQDIKIERRGGRDSHLGY